MRRQPGVATGPPPWSPGSAVRPLHSAPVATPPTRPTAAATWPNSRCSPSWPTPANPGGHGNTLIAMASAHREPKVVVLGGGSWGTTVASICARRGPTLQWVRSAETAEDINTNHRNTALPRRRRRCCPSRCGPPPTSPRPPTAPTSSSWGCRRTASAACSPNSPRNCGRGCRWCRLVKGLEQGTNMRMSADRRRGAARPPGRHPGRAEHRPRGRRRLRGRGGAGDARPAPGRQSGKAVPHQAFPHLHHRRRGRRRDGRRAEERLRDRRRDGLLAGHRREHPRDGDDPRGARDVQARRGDGRAPRHLRRPGRHGRPDRHLHQPAQPQPARRRATGRGQAASPRSSRR